MCLYVEEYKESLQTLKEQTDGKYDHVYLNSIIRRIHVDLRIKLRRPHRMIHMSMRACKR